MWDFVTECAEFPWWVDFGFPRVVSTLSKSPLPSLLYHVSFLSFLGIYYAATERAAIGLLGGFRLSMIDVSSSGNRHMKPRLVLLTFFAPNSLRGCFLWCKVNPVKTCVCGKRTIPSISSGFLLWCVVSFEHTIQLRTLRIIHTW